MYLYKSHRPCWAEINMEALAGNVRSIKSRLKPEMGLIGVVKADAYGHGAVNVSQELIKLGVEYLAISSIDEAMELRNSGILSPIIILGPVEPVEYGKLLELNIYPTIISLDYARELSEVFKFRGVFVKIHIKVDTGMGRLGIPIDNALMDIEQIAKLDGFIIDGIYSHFSSSDSDLEYSRYQLGRFTDLLGELKKIGVKIKHFHIANSAAIYDLPESIAAPFTMARPGLSIYGYSVNPNPELKNTMTLKAKVMVLNKMKKGESVSYQRTYTVTAERETIALLPVGYADGIPTLYSNKGFVTIKGKSYPTVGRVCMDYMMVSLGHNPDGVSVGDEATLFGIGGTSVEEFGKINMMNPYEVTCGVSKRVPRIYQMKEDER